jgi:hypothetical protein
MTVSRYDPEHGWVPACIDDIDFEVYRHGNGWLWEGYYHDRLLDSGEVLTKASLAWALWRARHRLRRQIGREFARRP